MAPSGRTIGVAAIGVAGIALVAASLLPFRSSINAASPALALIVPIVATALVGGRVAALVVASAGVLAYDLVFLPPSGALTIHAADDVIALCVFGLVAVVVGTLVARERRRRALAEEHAAEVETLNEALRSADSERRRLSEDATRAAVLERVDAQRKALLRSVSHDLRTPLAAIRAVATDLLVNDDYDSVARHELLELVADEADRLDRLVANLLSLSRIEGGALRPERTDVDLAELVAHTAGRLERVFVGRKVRTELPPGLPSVIGDYTQLGQVLSNLLENAARHSPVGGEITIGGREAGDRIELWVDDEGEGILPFERERVFEAFRSGSSSSGIGLAICRAIVEAHGGRIHAEVSPANGARLLVSLPRRHARSG